MSAKKNRTMGFNPLDELSDQTIDAIKHGAPVADDSSSPQAAQDTQDVEVLFASELVTVEHEVKEKAPRLHSPKASLIVKKWSQWSVAGGLVPLPLVDSLLISGAQIAMIRELCGHYEVPFEKKVALAVASGLVGGAATTTVAQVATRAVVRSMPIIGTIFTLTAEPALSYATTYGIGHAFIRHFEADGTLETFNPREMSQSFSEHIEKGKQAFKNMAGKR